MKFSLCLIVASLVTIAASAQPPAPYTWTGVGPMGTARADACAVLLQDGRALVIGGIDSDGNALASAEFFNSDQSFTPAPALNTARAQLSCSVLSDGRVLVAGGTDGQGNAIASAEVLDLSVDPSLQAWQTVGNLNEARWGQTTTLLQNGQVLLAGGCDANGPKVSLELFDPVANQFTTIAGTLSSPRMHFAAALLQNGQVLLAGGSDGTQSLSTTDIFDPPSGSVSPGSNLLVARAGLTANTLLDGTVLIVGGNDGTEDLASAEIYDPVAKMFSFNWGSPTVPRSGHSAFVIPNNNNVLIVGGMSNGVATAACELYTFQGEFMPVGSTSTPRARAAGVAIGPGLVLTAGGSNDSGVEAHSGVNSGPSAGFVAFEQFPGALEPLLIAPYGAGFMPGEFVNFQVQIQNYPAGPRTQLVLAQLVTLDSGTADSSGNLPLSSTTTLANAAQGLWTIFATGQTSGLQATFVHAAILPLISLSFSCNPCSLGQVTTMTATVTNSNPSLYPGSIGSDPVVFSDGTLLGTVPANTTTSSGLFSKALSGGTHAITAGIPSNESGVALSDGFVGAASARTNLTVNKAVTAGQLSASPNPGRANLPVTLTATVPFVTGFPPTGSVTFFDGFLQIGLSPVSTSGTASASLVSGATTHSLTATYSGDSNYLGSTSPALSLVVNPKITPTINLAASPNPARASSQVTLTVTIPVASGNPTPTGSVTFFDGTTQLGSATINSQGNASLPAIFSTIGAHSITANYSGDSNYLSGTSAAVSLIVNPALTATVAGSASPNPFTISTIFSEDVTITATVSFPTGSPTPTGTVTFRNGSTGISTVPIESSTVSGTTVKAVLQVRPSATGVFDLTATYNGDVNYNSATSPVFVVTVN